jgi:uncharacterized membrane protein YgcG
VAGRLKLAFQPHCHVSPVGETFSSRRKNRGKRQVFFAPISDDSESAPLSKPVVDGCRDPLLHLLLLLLLLHGQLGPSTPSPSLSPPTDKPQPQPQPPFHPSKSSSPRQGIDFVAAAALGSCMEYGGGQDSRPGFVCRANVCRRHRRTSVALRPFPGPSRPGFPARLSGAGQAGAGELNTISQDERRPWSNNFGPSNSCDINTGVPTPAQDQPPPPALPRPAAHDPRSPRRVPSRSAVGLRSAPSREIAISGLPLNPRSARAPRALCEPKGRRARAAASAPLAVNFYVDKFEKNICHWDKKRRQARAPLSASQPASAGSRGSGGRGSGGSGVGRGGGGGESGHAHVDLARRCKSGESRPCEEWPGRARL